MTWTKPTSVVKYLGILLFNDSTESSCQWEGYIFPRVGSRTERQGASEGNRKESDVSSLPVKGIGFVLYLWSIVLFLRTNKYPVGS